jgi:hypothetical protein
MGSLYGYEVKSELPLRRLNRGPGTRGVLEVEVARTRLSLPNGEPKAVLEDDRGRRWYSSFETEDGWLLALPPTGSFLIDPDQRRVVVDPGDGDYELLEHRVASSAICTLLALRGDLVLHASAVEAGGRATIFCGPATRGKSTLARVLGEFGNAVIGEDGIDISLEEGPCAYPGARGVRVRAEDGRSAALVADPGPVEPEPSRVGALILLGERGGELRIERLEPALALALLTPHLVHSGGLASIGMAFGGLAKLLGSAPAFRVTLPDDLEALPEAAERLLESTAVRGMDSVGTRS